MFHHALGATDGVVAFADQLRDGGHRVTGADLFGARRSTRSRRASRMRGKLGWDEMSAPSRSSTAWGSARTHEIGPREGSPGCPSVRECLLSPSLFGGLTRQVGAEFGVASGWGELRGRVTERRRTDSLARVRPEFGHREEFDNDCRTGSKGRSSRVQGRGQRSRARTAWWARELERRELLAWVGENLTEVRRTAAGQRPVYWILGIGLVVGLAAHIGGYALRTSTTGEPLGLIADLLYALGFALWTGVVVVVFVQIIPEAKRRQYKEVLDAYEAALREEAGARSDDASPD